MITLVVILAIALISLGTYYNLYDNEVSSLAYYCWGFFVGAISIILFMLFLL